MSVFLVCVCSSLLSVIFSLFRLVWLCFAVLLYETSNTVRSFGLVVFSCFRVVFLPAVSLCCLITIVEVSPFGHLVRSHTDVLVP